MKKLTNMIGSFIIAIIFIAFPVIIGIGIGSDWLESENDVLIHPWLTLLWALCLVCTIIEVAVWTFGISESE